MNGNSQAVRIPQKYRLDATEVEIFKNSDGDLVLHAVPANRGQSLLKALNQFDDDYADILERQQRDQPPMQDRDTL